MKKRVTEFLNYKTMGELLEHAVVDLEKVLEDDNYKFTLGQYHFGENTPGGKCLVCVAGSVLAKSYKETLHRRLTPKDFPSKTRDRLHVVNFLAVGDFDTAYLTFYNVSNLPINFDYSTQTQDIKPILDNLNMTSLEKEVKYVRGYLYDIKRLVKFLEEKGI